MKILNDEGIKALSNFLNQYHVYGPTIVNNPYMLMKWVKEINDELAKGNKGTVEIKPWNCMTSRTIEFTIDAVMHIN